MNLPLDFWKCPECFGYCAVSCKKCPKCGHDRTSRQTTGEGCDSELALHEEVIRYCQGKRWPYVHSRTDIPSSIPCGAADFLILLPGGRLLIVELKSRHGKQTPQQMGWQMMVEAQGHKYHIVRSMDDFLKLLTDF